MKRWCRQFPESFSSLIAALVWGLMEPEALAIVGTRLRHSKMHARLGRCTMISDRMKLCRCSWGLTVLRIQHDRLIPHESSGQESLHILHETGFADPSVAAIAHQYCPPLPHVTCSLQLWGTGKLPHFAEENCETLNTSTKSCRLSKGVSWTHSLL